MLRLLSVSVLLLLCSCAPQDKGPSSYELSEIKRKHWLEQFSGIPGIHISRLIDIWGESKKSEKPEDYKLGEIITSLEKSEKPEGYEYRWSSYFEGQFGGGYVTGSITQRIYDKHGYSKGTIETPTQYYVEPETIISWCDILINTNTNGIITHVSYDSNRKYIEGGVCDLHFPFPEDFSKK